MVFLRKSGQSAGNSRRKSGQNKYNSMINRKLDVLIKEHYANTQCLSTWLCSWRNVHIANLLFIPSMYPICRKKRSLKIYWQFLSRIRSNDHSQSSCTTVDSWQLTINNWQLSVDSWVFFRFENKFSPKTLVYVRILLYLCSR